MSATSSSSSSSSSSAPPSSSSSSSHPIHVTFTPDPHSCPRWDHLAFDDGDDIELALTPILQWRQRTRFPQATAQEFAVEQIRHSLATSIYDNTGCRTVGDVRMLTDQDWRMRMHNHIPMMCTILLKYVVRQSYRRSTQYTPVSRQLMNAQVLVAKSAAAASSSMIVIDDDDDGEGPQPSKPSTSERIVPSSPSTTTGSTDSRGGGDDAVDAEEQRYLIALQNDFNYGRPFDMSLFADTLNTLQQMGYSTNHALEAICVSDLPNMQLNAALEFLFESDGSKRRRLRREACEKWGRRMVRDEATLLQQMLSAEELAKGGRNKDEQIDYLRQLMMTERARYEEEMKTQQSDNLDRLHRNLYKDYLRGVIAHDSITTVEWEQLTLYRRKHGITDDEHRTALQSLNFSQAQFQQLRAAASDIRRDEECVVCLDHKKDHILTPCMHLALCGRCATESPLKACPICQVKVRNIKRIFL